MGRDCIVRLATLLHIKNITHPLCCYKHGVGSVFEEHVFLLHFTCKKILCMLIFCMQVCLNEGNAAQ